MSNPETLEPKISPDMQGEYQIRLVVEDDSGLTSSDTVFVFAFNGRVGNIVSDAGDDQIFEISDSNLEITLSGTGSSVNADIERFIWTQTKGPLVLLKDSSSSQTTFEISGLNIKKATVFSFELTVIDSEGFSAVDTVSIVINTADDKIPDVDEIKDKNDGGGSDGEIEIEIKIKDVDSNKNYNVIWEQISGPSALISFDSLTGNDSVENEILVVKTTQAGEFEFLAYIDDGEGLSLQQIVNFTAVESSDGSISIDFGGSSDSSLDTGTTNSSTAAGGCSAINQDVPLSKSWPSILIFFTMILFLRRRRR